jgi:hypothetical protein
MYGIGQITEHIYSQVFHLYKTGKAANLHQGKGKRKTMA